MAVVRTVSVKGRGATLGHFILGSDTLGNKGKKRRKVRVKS